MRAEIEALQRAEERNQGDVSGQPKDPIVTVPTLERRGHVDVANPGASIFETLLPVRQKWNPVLAKDRRQT